MDSTEHLEEVTRSALDFVCKYPKYVVEVERRKNLLQAKLQAVKLEAEEQRLHMSMPESLQKVLAGKRLLLWKSLLEKYGYDDMNVVPFMMKGVELVGVHNAPSCYPPLLKPASLTLEDLQSSSIWRRRAAVGRVPKVDPSHIEYLESTAVEELQLGFMEGPFHSELEVTNHLGRSDWCVVRRFVLVQGAEMKLRPIDDCLEAQINQAYTVSSYLKLQDIDYIAGLALCIAERIASGQAGAAAGPWLGKCLDLSKAYKQMAICPEHCHLAVIFYHDLEGRPKYYVANSLMFGASFAVYSFNRVSRSLWFLFNKMLSIPCGVFYNDYPMFQPENLAENADHAASELLDLLGWKHAKTGTKASPFKVTFNVLGCKLDLTGIQSGSVVLENKPGRIDRLIELLEGIKSEGNVTRHQGQVIHGLMRYACGFFSGKFLHQVCAEVLSMSAPLARRSSLDVKAFCEYAIKTVRNARPRSLNCGFEKKPVLIFTDGCWEQGFAGIGAVLVDTADGACYVCSGEVSERLVKAWKISVGEFSICQIELYVVVLVRWQFPKRLHNRRLLCWVDNDAARFCLIKGLSPSVAMRELVREFYSVDAFAPTYSWIKRVPSKANPSDAPSRRCSDEILALLGIESETPFRQPESLVDLLLAGL